MNRKFLIFVFFLLLLFPFGMIGASEKHVTGSITMIYDRSINQNNDLSIEIQINFNMSSLEIVLDQGVDKLVIFSAIYDNWFQGDWIDTSIDRQYLSESGKYSGRVIAKPQSVNDTIDTLFFEFVIYRILTITESAITTAVIMFALTLPFVLDKQKQKAERFTWNKLTYRQFFSLYISKLYSKIRIPLIVTLGIEVSIILGLLLFNFGISPILIIKIAWSILIIAVSVIFIKRRWFT